jgi:hypothetical protein
MTSNSFPRKLIALGLACLVVSLPLNSSGQQSDDDKQRVLEQSGRAFVEAEAKSYIEKFANQHPPIEGMENFGSSAMFAVGLLLAADNYLKADTDKQRFHAVEQGATAYLAYAYAATPAVGLVVTAVVLVTGIIESNVASSYAEAQLAFYKDMQMTQLRINELQQRSNRATAARFIAVLEQTQVIVGSLNDVNRALLLDCRKPPSDFSALSKCLTLMTQALTVREQEIRAVDGLLSWPDTMIALLASAEQKKTTTDSAELAKAVRVKLTGVRDGTAKELADLDKAYETFASSYRQLAVAMISDEALQDPQRLDAVDQIRRQCLLDDTSLSFSAAELVYQISGERMRAQKKSANSVVNAKTISLHATSLLENFEQRRLACPSITADKDLANLVSIVRERLAGLPVP